MIYPRYLKFALLISSSASSVAMAHDGPRVWVAAFNGTVITETSENDYDPTTYAPTQVYTGELSPYFGAFTTQFPGYESPRDGSGNVPDGTWFGFKIAGPLLTLSADASHLVPTTERFVGQATVPQLSITYPDVPPDQAGAYTRKTATGVVNGYNFTNTIQEHTHLAYTYLGDGASSAASGPNGVYVLPMILTSDSLTHSKWYFLTFRKSSTDPMLTLAAGYAQTMATARPGDTDFDGKVDFADLLKVAQNFGTQSGAWWATGDFNFDGAVNFADLLSLAQNFGSTNTTFAADWAAAQSMVPEPTFIAIGFLAPTLMRRRHSAKVS